MLVYITVKPDMNTVRLMMSSKTKGVFWIQGKSNPTNDNYTLRIHLAKFLNISYSVVYLKGDSGLYKTFEIPDKT